MNGRLSLAADRAVRVAAAQDDIAFKGLMALLGGIELALVDLRLGRSMRSTDAKDYNIDKAIGALETGLRDYKRSVAQ
jgi:hypothetical protein